MKVFRSLSGPRSLAGHLRWVLLASSLSATQACATQNSTPVPEELRQAVGVLADGILSKDVEKILTVVSNDGLHDSDEIIAKAEIRRDLNDRSSYLARKLFSPLTDADLQLCKEKLDNVLFVSPYAFLRHHKNVYSLQLSHGIEGLVGVVIQGGGAKLANGCELRLWPVLFQRVGDKYLVYSYFFE